MQDLKAFVVAHDDGMRAVTFRTSLLNLRWHYPWQRTGRFAMRDQPENFSVFGSGNGEARREGMQEFRRSGGWRHVGQMWGASLLVLALGTGLIQVVGNAQAGGSLLWLFLGH